MRYEIHNLTTRTDSFVASAATRREAETIRNKWAVTWSSNRYVVRRCKGD
jgi:hypothetical protein